MPTIAQITNTPLVDEFLSDISGDGSHIVYSVPGTGSLDVKSFSSTLPNPPGGGELAGTEQVINGGVGDQIAAHISGNDQIVTYTDDQAGETSIRIFDTSSNTDTPLLTSGQAFLSEVSDDGNYVVATQVSLAGGSQIVEWDLSANPVALPAVVSISNQASNPTVSGDGSYVAYEDRSFFANPQQSQIVVLDVNNPSGFKQVGDANLMDVNPEISADGNWVVFQTTQLNGSGSDISLYNRQADTTTVITGAGEDMIPSISGDGRFVTYASTVAGETDIYVWDRDTNTTHQFDLPDVQRNASISTDGKYISFESKPDGFQFDVYRADNPLHDDFIV